MFNTIPIMYCNWKHGLPCSFFAIGHRRSIEIADRVHLHLTTLADVLSSSSTRIPTAVHSGPFFCKKNYAQTAEKSGPATAEMAQCAGGSGACTISTIYAIIQMHACMHIYLKIKNMYKCLLLRCLLNEREYLHLPLGRAGLGPPPRPSNGHKIIFNWLRYCYFVRLRVNWKLCGPRCDIYLFMWDRKVYYATVSLTKKIPKRNSQWVISVLVVGQHFLISDRMRGMQSGIKNKSTKYRMGFIANRTFSGIYKRNFKLYCIIIMNVLKLKPSRD